MIDSRVLELARGAGFLPACDYFLTLSNANLKAGIVHIVTILSLNVVLVPYLFELAISTLQGFRILSYFLIDIQSLLCLYRVLFMTFEKLLRPFILKQRWWI